MEYHYLYNKEYRAYMEYALQRFLIEVKGYSEYDARVKVMQDFKIIETEAKKERFI